MNFQSKHMENNSYEKLNSMTIVIAIKCNEGVVIATDNKGIARDFITVKKIYPIHDFRGLGGAGDTDHVEILANALNQD
jgi:20S proteasome alpha/beta subunit